MRSVVGSMASLPKQIELIHQKQYRIIPSTFPPINFFEGLVDPDEMEILWEIESLTNERLRQEAGDLFLVPKEDWVSGPGSSVIMAAFTHIGKASRFTDGSFGIYYAGATFETAIRETVFHRERFLKATQEDACELTMRLYESEVKKPLHDIRGSAFKNLHDPNDYEAAQQYGKLLREQKSWGLVYRSVRDPGKYCVAVLRPPALSIPKQTTHLRYLWNGQRITDVLDTRSILTFK